jgi:hypothetical protein
VITNELTTTVNCCELLKPAESVTVIVKVKPPAIVGFPVICTLFVVLEDKESPVGKAPEVTAQESGSNPPVAVTVAL